MLAPLVFIFGLYIIIHGHVTPGGGFQGGAVFASGAGLLLIAFGSEAISKYVKEHYLIFGESIGSLMFIGLGFLGLAVTFFFNFLVGSPFFGRIPPSGPNSGDLWTSGLLPLMDIAVGLKVTAGISAVFVALAVATHQREVKK
jgi:multicomponent Na+:H+ antiporter subunit B